jgi:hypothetical protein
LALGRAFVISISGGEWGTFRPDNRQKALVAALAYAGMLAYIERVVAHLRALTHH